MANRISINLDTKAEQDLKAIETSLKQLTYKDIKKYSNISAICREGISKVRKAIERKIKKLGEEGSTVKG